MVSLGTLVPNTVQLSRKVTSTRKLHESNSHATRAQLVSDSRATPKKLTDDSRATRE